MVHLKVGRSRNKTVEPKLLPKNEPNGLRIVSWVRMNTKLDRFCPKNVHTYSKENCAKVLWFFFFSILQDWIGGLDHVPTLFAIRGVTTTFSSTSPKKITDRWLASPILCQTIRYLENLGKTSFLLVLPGGFAPSYSLQTTTTGAAVSLSVCTLSELITAHLRMLDPWASPAKKYS